MMLLLPSSNLWLPVAKKKSKSLVAATRNSYRACITGLIRKCTKLCFILPPKKMKLKTELECIIATESSKTPTKIQKQRLEIIVIHYHYGRLVSILHSALVICNAPLVFSHLLLSTEHSLDVCP